MSRWRLSRLPIIPLPSTEGLHRVRSTLVSPVSPWAGMTSIQGPSLSSFQYRECLLRILPLDNSQEDPDPARRKWRALCEHRGDHSPQDRGNFAEYSPVLLSALRGPAPCHSLQAKVPPCFLSQGLQEPRDESTGLKLLSSGCRAERVQAVPGV